MNAVDVGRQTGPTPIGAAPGWDIYASGVSVLCLLHCIAPPILAAFLPAAGMLTGEHWVHQVLVLLTTPVTLWVIWTSKKHVSFNSFAPIALFGLTLLLIAAFLPAVEAYEKPVTIVGAVTLAVAHIMR